MGTTRDVQVVLAHADPGVRRRFTRVLTHVGHHVEAVDAVDAAVERCRRRPPDVVLVDVALCRDDEQELLAALKGDAEAYRTAVVLLERPDLDLGTAVTALRRGVQDFLVEPIGDAELVARVEAAGRTKVLQEELVVQSARLEAMLFEDPLTGLSNRRFILTQLGGRDQRRTPPRAARCRSRSSTSTTSRPSTTSTATPPATACWPRSPRALREHLRAEDQLGPPRRRGVPRPAARHRRRARPPRAAEKLRAEVAALTVEHEGRRAWASRSASAGRPGRARRPRSCCAAPTRRCTRPRRAGRDRVAGAPATVPRRI